MERSNQHNANTCKIKVCGMRDFDNLAEVAECRPEYMGFIFYPKSPRNACQTSPDAVKQLPSSVTPVGVFVNETLETVVETCEKYGITTVQLHGSEAPALCKELKKRGFTVFKAAGINVDFDWEQLDKYADCVDMFVFDTATASHGGSGQKYDWSILEAYHSPIPFLLSGGISINDIEQIKHLTHPRLRGVDINSRFETAPGQKDTTLLRSFITQIRDFK